MPKNILIYSDGTGMAGGIRFESRGVRPSFCVATILRPNVRFGSEADILGGLRDFTPESRHKSWPKLRSAHQLRQQGDGLIASGCMVALPAQINNKSDEAQ